jgi:uncharacterized phage-associated protein
MRGRIMTEELSLPYEVIKGLQVLKYITSKHPDQEYYKVLKMLYLADKVHLLKYGKLIVPDKYEKYAHGPVPSLCYEIVKYVSDRQEYYSHPFDERIKKEIEVIKSPETGKLTKLHNLTDPDLDYLSEINIECLDEAIKNYGHLDSNALKELTHDEIYNSITELNDEITIIDMANVLDKSGVLTEHVLEFFPYKVI